MVESLGPLAEFAHREYDLTSRHVLVARLVESMVGGGGRLLDIGGAAGLTRTSLPAHDVIVADIIDDGVDVLASGAALPFADDTFEAAVMLDVLEHVNADTKPQLLSEAMRVAPVLIVVGPCWSEEVVAAEATQRAAFEAMFDRPHPWLSEHYDCGLPEASAIAGQLEAAGYATLQFGTNPLALWSELLFQSHVGLRLGDADALHEFRRWLLTDFLERGDAAPPSYRQVIVASRDPARLDAIGVLVPGADEDAVAEAVVGARTALAALISDVVDKTDASRRELDEGWRSTVAELERTREGARARESELVNAVDAANAGWRTSIDAIAALDKRVGELADYADRLEFRLIARPETWLADVGGPSATTDLGRVDSAAAADDYDAWIAACEPPVPPTSGPRFSILTPVFNPPAEFLEACIRSVRSQTYPDWELVLVNASDEPYVAAICDRFASLDSRIVVVDVPNRGIAANTNVGAEAASGEWIALLDHDDELAPHALAAVALAINANPDAGLVYSDEDKIDDVGRRSDPFFKPDWSPDLLTMVNYVGHFLAIRRSVWDDIGGEREGFDGAQDYDLVLRASRAAGEIVHVPDVLYHWRTHSASTASDVRVKPDAHFAGRRALLEYVQVVDRGASVEIGPGPTSHRVRYPVPAQAVSIVVPFRDKPELTGECLDSLARFEPGMPFEVLAVSNRSEQPETSRAIADWSEQYDWLRVDEFDEPFNFQRLNNWAVARTSGSLVLFLNNDVEAIHDGWLSAMAEQALRSEIGAVGARLFYPNGLIQHAGVFVGIGGYADHPWAGLHPDSWTPAGPSYWTRNFLAVTAACLLVERSKFTEVGGFDESFIVGGGDVDLGIRLFDAGYRNVLCPFARLIHKESASRGSQVAESDLEHSRRVYGRFLEEGDPYANPNISLADTTCRISDVTRAPASSTRG